MRRSIVLWAGLALFLVGFPAAGAEQEEQGDGAEWHWFGTLRMRPEYNENLSDVSATRDDKIAYVAYRTNVGFRVDLEPDIEVLVDGQVVGLWGEDESPYGGITMDPSGSDFSLFQAYAKADNVLGTNMGLTVGRQKLAYGDEWLLGDLDFYNGTSFDAIRADFNHSKCSTSLFWSKVNETSTPDMLATTPDTSGDRDLYGGWFHREITKRQDIETAVIYLLDHREDMLLASDDITLIRVPYRDKRWTYTLSYEWGDDVGGFFRGNGALQWGAGLVLDDMDQPTEIDVDAEAWELTGGYVWERDGNPYKLWGRYAHYSGDDLSTQDNEAFNPLFQDFHARNGYLDFWTGLWGFRPYLGGQPGLDMLQLGATADIPGGIVLTFLAQKIERDEPAEGGSGSKRLGHEFGVSASYDYGERVTLELGVAQLYPSTALEREPPLFGSSTARRVYVNSSVRF